MYHYVSICNTCAFSLSVSGTKIAAIAARYKKRYKYTINKRIIKQNNNKFNIKENRYNTVYCSGYYNFVIPLFRCSYFPIQKFRKIFPKISSVEISPVISPR
jgi:hypothetical protein